MQNGKDGTQMKATGIVRRIDELGRVVIPKEIRRTQRIRRGDPLEIFTTGDGEVIFKKYSPVGELQGVAVQYAFPVLAFGLGMLMTFVIRRRFRNRTNRIHWRQLGVLAEILLLTLVAFLPQQANLLANSLISLACGFQVEAFRKIHGNAIATTMCIGNLRAGIHAAAEFGFSRKREDRNRAITYFTVILAFALGAVLGNLAIAQWGTWAILGSSALLLVCFGLMFFQGKEGEGHGTA